MPGAAALSLDRRFTANPRSTTDQLLSAENVLAERVKGLVSQEHAAGRTSHQQPIPGA